MAHDYPEAYTFDNLMQILNANDSCPPLAEDEVKRIIDLAKQRASKRGEESALDETQVDCIIATEWSGFAAGEFGHDNGEVNQFAMGIYEHDASLGKDADLFSETVIIQNGWLTTGDGRRASIEEYVDEDYDKATPGNMWIPHGAQEYICICALDDELLFEEPSAAEAM